MTPSIALETLLPASTSASRTAAAAASHRRSGSSAFSRSRKHLISRRPLALVLAIVVLGTFFFRLDDARSTASETLGASVAGEPSRRPKGEGGGPAAHLRPSQGPTDRFRDSLRPDKRYITSFQVAGFNNQLIGAIHLLHLAFLLQQPPYPLPHVVVLPPITPHSGHLGAAGTGRSVEPYPVGEIFDLRAFEDETGIAVVEWRDVKKLENVNVPGYPREDVACWSPHMTQFDGRQHGDMEHQLGLKTIMTPISPSILTAKDHHPPLILLPHLATILSPPVNDLRSDFLSGASGEAERLMTTWGHSDMRWTDVWGPSVPGWREPEGRSPGELVCLDSLYFASERGEGVTDLYVGGSTDKGPWAMVGRHFRWHPKLKAQAEDVVRAVLGLAAGAPLPHLLTVHIRRTDFLPACYGEPCLRVVHYERRLHDVQAQLAAAGFDDVKSWPVLVTTDEADPTYLAELAAKGWHVVDHVVLETKATAGDWGPTLLDNVLLSLAKGFVGTSGSTMSLLALRRVAGWNDGAIALVSYLDR